MTKSPNGSSIGITIGLGIVLQVVVLAAFGVFGGGAPTITAPSPMPLFAAYVMIGPTAFGLPVLLFWLWCVPLFRGESRFPARSTLLLVAGVIASIAWLWTGRWRDSWGPEMLLISTLLVGVTVGLVVACRRHPTFWINATASVIG